jgi:hypothetical protein
MAAKCKREKKALDKAEGRTNTEQADMEGWEKRIVDHEAAAQYTLAQAISGCMDSEQRLDEKCVIDNWIHAHKLLEEARGFQEYVDFYYARWMMAQAEEERLREEYCDCLNRERSR